MSRVDVTERVAGDDDPVTTVLIGDHALEEGGTSRAIYTQGKSDGSLVPDYPTTALLGLVPCLLAERCAAKGAGFIDAPVSGTVAPAKDGKLMALVGGSEQDLERARPALDVLTRRIVHAGPVGQGAMLKLVLNLPLAVYWQSLAEAVALGAAGGLELATILDAMADSGAATRVLPLKVPLILEGSDYVAFDIATMEKDATSIVETGEAFGVPMPTISAALATYAAANAAGMGADDAVSIVRRLTDSLEAARED